MDKFWLITKVNLLGFLNYQNRNNKKKKRNSIGLIILIAIILYLFFYFYEITKFIVPGFISLNKPLSFFGVIFNVLSIFIIFYNVFKVKNILFDFKDYDLLFSLPISKKIIILSKIVSLYLVNLMFTIIFMVSSFISYSNFLEVPNPFIYFLLIPFIPLIPLAISLIIGVILSWIVGHFKHKSISSYLLNISLFVFFFLLSFRMNDMSSIDIANIGLIGMNKISSIYPFTNLYVNILTYNNVIDLLLYLLVSVSLLSTFIAIINYLYASIRSKLLVTHVKENYIIGSYKHNSCLKSLYKKEIKRFLINPLYPLNTMVGFLFLIVFIVLLLLLKDEFITDTFHIVLSGNSIIMIMSLFCALSSTTFPSISLEGKSYWIMKMLPTKITNIFLSKIFVNLTFLIPLIIIGSTFFGVYLRIDSSLFILLYLTPLSYALFTSIFGLLLNLIYPKFDYDNEIRVIKQTLPAFLSIFVNILMVIIPFQILGFSVMGIISITILMYVIDIILVFILKYYGTKKFIQL